MKPSMTTRLRIALALCLCSSAAWSQQEPTPPHERDPVEEHLFPPELIMSNQNALDLDEEQKQAIRTEVQNAQMRFTEVQWKLHDAMEMLGHLLETEPTDEVAVMEHLDEVLDAEREVKRTQLTLMIRIKNELSPAQRRTLRELRAELR